MDPQPASSWYLEGLVGDPPSLRQVSVNTLPFRIGRRPEASFRLNGVGVSKDHAEIHKVNGQLVLRDLGSRNGTFVNGSQIQHDAPLKHGDVLHFANQEFRLTNQSAADYGRTMQIDSSDWVRSIGQFEKLFAPGTATPFYQPIVSLPDGGLLGYEVLARSSVDGLCNPGHMFNVATRLNMEAALSRLFRHEGVRQGLDLHGHPNLFLNTHPTELSDEGLIESLIELREAAPTVQLTLEIHEAAVTDLDKMTRLHASLEELDIHLAYDDFGAGQARLVDLIEVPPDFLKFDIALVRDIHRAATQRVQMLETLVRMAHDLGVAVLAEGIECQAEGDACAQLGFDLAQGYHYGKPAPAAELAAV